MITALHICAAQLKLGSGAYASCGLAHGHTGPHKGNVPGSTQGGICWGTPTERSTA